jgi:hypothetical protein
VGMLECHMYQADLKSPNSVLKKKYANRAWFFIIICGFTALCLIWVLHYWYITMIYIDVNTYTHQDVRVGGYKNKPKLDTSDWQTYQNEKFGFEFKYPKNINYLYIPEYPDILYFSSEEIDLSVDTVAPITPMRLSIKKDKDILEKIGNYKATYRYEDLEEKNVIVDSVQGTQISGKVTNSGTYIYEKYNIELFIPVDTFYIHFSFVDLASDNIDNNVFNKIISTFKFIEPIDTSDWQTYQNEEYGFEFKYPSKGEYEEKDSLREKGIKYSGKELSFIDKKNILPRFFVLTKDFSVVDSFPHDIVNGTLESDTSFDINLYNDQYEQIIKKNEGVYQVIGYGNIECSPFVSSYLIVQPPTESEIKYIAFSLGGTDRFSDEEIDGICIPKDKAITKRINAIKNGEFKEINVSLEDALNISKTFKFIE